MTVTATSFRAQFSPAFDNATKFTDASIDSYIALAGLLLDPTRWGTVLDFGTMWFTAHMETMDAIASQSGANGVPGTAVGVVSGGTVDKVSYSRDVQSVIEKDGGFWNMSTYGTIFLRYAKQFGMGPVQIGAPNCQDAYDFPTSVYAWPGPMTGGIF